MCREFVFCWRQKFCCKFFEAEALSCSVLYKKQHNKQQSNSGKDYCSTFTLWSRVKSHELFSLEVCRWLKLVGFNSWAAQLRQNSRSFLVQPHYCCSGGCACLLNKGINKCSSLWKPGNRQHCLAQVDGYSKGKCEKIIRKKLPALGVR